MNSPYFKLWLPASDGAYTVTLSQELQALEELRWKWQYYRMKEQPVP